MVEGTEPSWGFMTNYAQVLVSIAPDPSYNNCTASGVCTERTVHRIVREFYAAGRTARERTGRRKPLHGVRPLPDSRPDRGRAEPPGAALDPDRRAHN